MIDAPQQFANLRAIQYVTYFPNDRLADKERYVAIEKQPQRLAGWAVMVGDLRRLVGHKRRVAAIAFAPDGETIVSGSWDLSVKLWDVTTEQEIRSFPTSNK